LRRSCGTVGRLARESLVRTPSRTRRRPRAALAVVGPELLNQHRADPYERDVPRSLARRSAARPDRHLGAVGQHREVPARPMPKRRRRSNDWNAGRRASCTGVERGHDPTEERRDAILQPASSSAMSSGIRSRRVDSICPNLTKIGLVLRRAATARRAAQTCARTWNARAIGRTA
jgi:hypothetical protein